MCIRDSCWPYPANCTESGFPRGLTGILDENNERTYLDPRMSDTDGDGMPDGFEAYMCQRIGGFDETTLRYDCGSYNPLNGSDLTSDGDNDGFDVDRDGTLSPAERFTATYEYSFGCPSGFSTESYVLLFHSSFPSLSPFIS